MAAKKQQTLALFREAFELTEELSNEQFGALMRAVGNFRFEGGGYEGEDPAVRMAFGFISAQVERYEDFCRTHRDNARRKNKKEEEPQENTGEALQKDADGRERTGEVTENDPISPCPEALEDPFFPFEAAQRDAAECESLQKEAKYPSISMSMSSSMSKSMSMSPSISQSMSISDKKKEREAASPRHTHDYESSDHFGNGTSPP